MSEPLTKQGVRDLDAKLGPPPRLPNVADRQNCVERGEAHRWRPTGEEWIDPDDPFDDSLAGYGCAVCGVTEWRPR